MAQMKLFILKPSNVTAQYVLQDLTIKQLKLYKMSHVTRKPVFGVVRPGKTQTSLLSWSD